MSGRRRRTDLGRTTRSRGPYTVVRWGNTDCRWIWIHADLAEADEVGYPRCWTSFPEPHLEAVYTTDDYTDAVGVRAAALADDADHLDEYNAEWPNIDEQVDRAEERIQATTATPALSGPAVSPDSDYSPWDQVDISPFTAAQQTYIEDAVEDHLERHGPATGPSPEPSRPPVDVDDAPGIHARRPGDQLDVAGAIDLRGVGPSRRAWLPDLLKATVDTGGPAPAVDVMATLLKERAPADMNIVGVRPNDREVGRTQRVMSAVVDDVLDRPDDGGANRGFLEADDYPRALAEYTVRFAGRRDDDLDDWEEDDRDDLRDRLTTIATGTGASNASLEALADFASAGVPTFVSVSPTYPTLTRANLRYILERISEALPTLDVVFHEALNPRGQAISQMRSAAVEAERVELASALETIEGDTETWYEYATEQLAWMQELGDELALPVNLWPGDVVDAASTKREWSRWAGAKARPSPERFPTVEDPSPLDEPLEPFLDDVWSNR